MYFRAACKLNGNKDAKRAALIHFLFNVIGTVIMAVLLLVGENWVENMITTLSGGNIGRSVANAHTLFKVFQVLILLPFSGAIVKMTYLFVPGKDEEVSDSGFKLEYIGPTNVFSPSTAVVEATKELERMGNMAITNLNRAMNALITMDENEIAEVYRVEKQIDYFLQFMV